MKSLRLEIFNECVLGLSRRMYLGDETTLRPSIEGRIQSEVDLLSMLYFIHRGIRRHLASWEYNQIPQ